MRFWIKAFRLRTLPLALSGWLVGLALTLIAQKIDFSIAALTILTAFLLQILSNLANDLGDATSGVDHERQGEERMVSAGLISFPAMKRAVFICALLTLVSGVSLLYLAFPDNLLSAMLFLTLGIAGIAAAIKYTVGKNPYGYAGFGDFFVLVFFGFVLVYGTFYLQVQEFHWQPLLPAASIGFFAVGVLNVNNIRDIQSDQKAGKYSIPVRLGKSKAVIYHLLLLGFGLLLSVLFVFSQEVVWIEFIFLLVAIPFVRNIIAVKEKTGHELDPYLKQMAISTLAFSVLFLLGQSLKSIL